MGTSECTVACNEAEDTYLALANDDLTTQTYLREKKVDKILLELLSRVIEERPDNILSFLPQATHNMQKNPPPGLQ